MVFTSQLQSGHEHEMRFRSTAGAYVRLDIRTHFIIIRLLAVLSLLWFMLRDKPSPRFVDTIRGCLYPI